MLIILVVLIEFLVLTGTMLTAGITTSLYPCLFPLLPSYLALTMQTGNSRRKGVLSAVYLTLGIVTTFLLLAVIIKFSIGNIMNFLIKSSVDLNVILSLILFISVMIIFIGPEKLPLVNRTPQLAQNVLNKAQDDTMSTAYIMGLVYTLIAAPCAFPVFFVVISEIIILDNLTAFLAILIYSFGSGIPFMILGGLIPEAKQTIFQKYRSIAPKIKYITAGILLFMALYLFDNFYFFYNPIEIGNAFYYNGLGLDLWNTFIYSLLAVIVFVGGVTFLTLYILYRKEKKRLAKSTE
jgi:cytochrome c biogenesis protein CcdA